METIVPADARMDAIGGIRITPMQILVYSYPRVLSDLYVVEV